MRANRVRIAFNLFAHNTRSSLGNRRLSELESLFNWCPEGYWLGLRGIIALFCGDIRWIFAFKAQDLLSCESARPTQVFSFFLEVPSNLAAKSVARTKPIKAPICLRSLKNLYGFYKAIFRCVFLQKLAHCTKRCSITSFCQNPQRNIALKSRKSFSPRSGAVAKGDWGIDTWNLILPFPLTHVARLSRRFTKNSPKHSVGEVKFYT